MKKSELEYANLVKLTKPYEAKGRSESATFLNWFLEHIYRLDDVAADDAICDEFNDKGIDGVYVDTINEEVHVFQARIRKKPGGTIGDTDLKTFAGSVDQLTTPEKIDLVLAGSANNELKGIITKIDLKEKLKNGFKVIGVFVTNQDKDKNTVEYLKINKTLLIFDRALIASSYVDIEDEGGIDGTFTFNIDQPPLHFPVSSIANVYLFPASAADLIKLNGISDGNLFSRNVRLSLGTTKVNKDIAASISDTKEHIKFPLYHNGITLICDGATYNGEKNQITITDYSVVNGAQSLTSLYSHRDSITKDLSIILKVIELKGNRELANLITINSNNQNAIKPRDLRSNHVIQQRLKAEFQKLPFGKYDFEIKRGETSDGKEIITNENAGRMLLAFDHNNPSSCHQIYKLFDELYSDIFGRKEVDATRIAFLHETMKLINAAVENVQNKSFGHYALTKYFLLSVLSTILRKDPAGEKIFAAPNLVFADKKSLEGYKSAISTLLSGLVVDLNYEANDTVDATGLFDYKEILKSPQKVKDLTASLMRSFEKDVVRKKASPFEVLWTASKETGKKQANLI